MKKFLAVVIAVVALVGAAFAAETVQFPSNINGALPYVQPFSVITATIGPQTGSAGTLTNSYNFGIPMRTYTCNQVFSGVTPTSVGITIQGSIDGTYWTSLFTNGTDTATNGAHFGITSGPSVTVVNRIRASITSMPTYSAGKSKLTINCTAFQ